ncbi:solute carrier family 2, facilitated glucose transporter member 4-like [Empidonax traillii]|uniref:solute carrier family 2, facilitated glucose transporter member 4-like n=1 Tax=Empidonax traillii TaxID=164674 RepID=UPI000FFD72FA|nr:solute carrier family 2, facilitated glucose transporter member 4-like [Empidonax traillii]
MSPFLVLGLRALLGTPRAWPALLGAGLVPAALQLLLLPLCPESPRFLLARGQHGRARRASSSSPSPLFPPRPGLSRLAGPAAEAGLAALEAELGRGSAPRVGLWELVRSRRFRQPLVVTVGMQLAQQLSGINAIFYYSTSIFEAGGLRDPTLGTIGTGVVNVAATALSVVLVERAGRRILQLVGLLGMMGCAGTLGVALKLGGPAWGGVALAAALAFVAFFAVGPGPLPWFVGAELFPPGVVVESNPSPKGSEGEFPPVTFRVLQISRDFSARAWRSVQECSELSRDFTTSPPCSALQTSRDFALAFTQERL